MLILNLLLAAPLALLPTQTPAPECGDTQPGQRAGHILAYDTKARQVVMFGGLDSSNNSPKTLWGWDGVRWTCLSATGPQGRQDAAMAYDAARSRLVLYGGRSRQDGKVTVLRDTWEWDGKQWTLADSAGPGERVHMSLAYDATHKTVLLVGGLDDASGPDTWEWRNSHWTKLPIAPPDSGIIINIVGTATEPAKLVLAVPDSATEKSGLFRLQLASIKANAWTREFASRYPVFSPKENSVMTRAGVVFYSGFPPEGATSSWVQDRTGWRSLAGSPTRRRGTAIAYDQSRNRVVVIGGFDGKNGLGDIWESDLQSWRQVQPRKVQEQQAQEQ